MKKIYIVLTHTGTTLSKIIKTYTKDEFSHVSIALDNKLQEMYSFGRLHPYNPFWGGDEIEIRDNAMLHIFLNCGLRLSEIKNLNIEDINLDDNKFTIIGKGNKERTNYLNKKTKDALIKYLKIRDNSHDNNKKHNNALFLTFYGYRMSQFTINKIVKRAYRKAELDENVYTVHTLRHTCATLLYRSGVNIKTIQELLGHVHIDTTEIYTHLDNQEVKDVMFEHPLAQFKMEDALAYCA
ncbi:MAG: tyrosine-type recombinase/integrase [Clostridia bacterium]